MVPGNRIGRFEVVETLGQGGIATVYRVRHTRLDTLHAIKILKVGHSGLARRLLQEGRIQAQLHHPNVVAVTDVIEDGGSIGLLMELVDGFSLEDCLAGDPMELEEALDIFRQVLDGVAAAHAAGVTHRDLKPGNILLTTRGDRVVAKVTDFGIAKVFSEEGSPSMTRAGSTMGTPGYMAPEQMRNSAGVDLRADIFALGAILYEMIVGRPAFRGDDMLGTLTRVAQGRYTPVQELVPGVPSRVDEAIARALQPEADDRFPDCDSFARALFGQGTGATAPDAGPSRRPRSVESASPTLAPSVLDQHLLSQAFEEPQPDLLDEPVSDDNSTYPERILPRDLFTNETLDFQRSQVEVDPDEDVDDEVTEDVVTAGEASAIPDLLSRPPPEQAADEGEQERAVDSMDAEDAANSYMELLRAMTEAIVWAIGRFLRYGAFPSLAFVIFLWWISVRASYRMEQLAAREQATAAALQTSMDASANLVPTMIAGGAEQSVLEAQRKRYEQAETFDARITAAKELSSVMSVQLSRMPAAESMQEQEQRRRVELALARIDQDILAYDAAREAHEDQAGSLAGRMANLFGMVDEG